MSVKILPAHENAVLIEWMEPSCTDLTQKIVELQRKVREKYKNRVLDTIPAYATLMVVFDENQLSRAQLTSELAELASEQGEVDLAERGRLHRIPVDYSLESGLDLAKVAQVKGVSIEQIIAWHSAVEYQVMAVGFSPAFAYLGALRPELAMPRLAEPRLSVPAGSVAIADRQTAIYPVESPGGWHILGRTALDLSLANPENLTRFKVGDWVRFEVSCV